MLGSGSPVGLFTSCLVLIKQETEPEAGGIWGKFCHLAMGGRCRGKTWLGQSGAHSCLPGYPTKSPRGQWLKQKSLIITGKVSMKPECPQRSSYSVPCDNLTPRQVLSPDEAQQTMVHRTHLLGCLFFVNESLLEHSHSRLFICRLRLLSHNSRSEQEPRKPGGVMGKAKGHLEALPRPYGPVAHPERWAGGRRGWISSFI